jgi:hypothetical protein
MAVVINKVSCVCLAGSEWKKELGKKQHGALPSLRWAMWRAFGKQFMTYGLILLVEVPD